MMAAQNAQNLAAQSVATPAQQIVREFHRVEQPIYIPTPQAPQPIPINITTPTQDYSDMMRQFGMTMQQIFLAQQQVPVQRRPPEDIDIQYTNQGPPPGAPPGGGREMVRSFGPARLPRERMAPFQSGGPPPAAPGGATAPMLPREPAPTMRRQESVPIRREYFPRRRQEPPAPPPAPPPPPAQPAQPARKRKAPQQDGPVTLKPYRQPRGPGYKLDDEEPRFVPFSGRAQRLPEDDGGGNLRANAIQRMREIGHQSAQRRRAREMLDRQADLGRALRRGGARGDVVGTGKRKRDDAFVPNPRRRTGDRPPGPQEFSIAT